MGSKEENRMRFTNPWVHSDVIFKVEGKRIHASKAVLSLASPVFDKMLTADFKEKDASEILLPEKNYDGFLELMTVVHIPEMVVDSKCFY